ncbi:MAG: HobA family DNA replication regulator [candidate division WOR-3 bacterium]
MFNGFENPQRNTNKISQQESCHPEPKRNGKNDPRSEIAKRADNSCLWLLDEEFGHAMKLRSYDPYLDIKLMQLYRLFDLSLNAVLFGEVDTDE